MTIGRRKYLIDARPLQDENYRRRGIGQHIAALLRGGRAVLPAGTRFVALVDPRLAVLEDDLRSLFDETALNSAAHEDADVFVQTSPMTHDPLFCALALTQRRTLSAAIIYDFIPHDWAGRYLADPAARRDYVRALRWLDAYDMFLPISDYAAERLSALAKVEAARVFVSGVAVRDSIVSHVPPSPHGGFVVAGGGDWRKNPEVAVAAHARSRELQTRRIKLRLSGKYPQDTRDRLAELCRVNGGDLDLVEYRVDLSDAELAAAYAGAIGTICPSYVEGFSIPVIEANANNCPVLVSDCAAHAELIADAADRFGPDDVDHLSALMESLLRPGAREETAARQSGLWRRFTESAVAERFWRPIRDRLEAARPVAPRTGAGNRNKPRLAILSPVPPDFTGVSIYTVNFLAEMTNQAHVDVYTSTRSPKPIAGVERILPLSPHAQLSRSYDAVVNVIGNSHFHQPIFEQMMTYGGASILHDSRMLDFYVHLLGPDRALRLASTELGRQVEWRELDTWLGNPRRLPTLFLSEALRASSPAFLHSPTTMEFVDRVYGNGEMRGSAELLPFAVNRPIPREHLTRANFQEIRRELGIAPGQKLISMFGWPQADKCIDECIWALESLASWGVDAKLAFVGAASPPIAAHLRALSQSLGVGDKLIIFESEVAEPLFRKFLIGSDAAIQLRLYLLGQMSGGLQDCIASGLPTVTNDHMARTMSAPDFIRRVPDGISPVLIAEQLREIFLSGEDRFAHDEAMERYRDIHSFRHYCELLIDGVMRKAA